MFREVFGVVCLGFSSGSSRGFGVEGVEIRLGSRVMI